MGEGKERLGEHASKKVSIQQQLSNHVNAIAGAIKTLPVMPKKRRVKIALHPWKFKMGQSPIKINKVCLFQDV